MTTEQGSLFPSDEKAPVVPIDTSASGRHIAEHARPVEDVDRTSEAAIDQGFGPVPLPVPKAEGAVPEVPTSPATRSKPETRAEMNAREDRRIAAHLARIGRSPSSVRDPNYR